MTPLDHPLTFGATAFFNTTPRCYITTRKDLGQCKASNGLTHSEQRKLFTFVELFNWRGSAGAHRSQLVHLSDDCIQECLVCGVLGSEGHNLRSEIGVFRLQTGNLRLEMGIPCAYFRIADWQDILKPARRPIDTTSKQSLAGCTWQQKSLRSKQLSQAVRPR